MKKTFLFAMLIMAGICSSAKAQGPKPPHEILVDKIVKALRKENAKQFASSCVPTQINFNELSNAGYSSRPDIAKGLQTKASRDTLIKKEKESFDHLVEDGKKDGIVWQKIKIKWVGIESKPIDKKINRLSIPFTILSNGKEYRIVLESCSQLIKKPEIILPGEFRYDGIQ